MIIWRVLSSFLSDDQKNKLISQAYNGAIQDVYPNAHCIHFYVHQLCYDVGDLSHPKSKIDIMILVSTVPNLSKIHVQIITSPKLGIDDK